MLRGKPGAAGNAAEPVQRLALELPAPFHSDSKAGGDLVMTLDVVADQAVATHEHLAVAHGRAAA